MKWTLAPLAKNALVEQLHKALMAEADTCILICSNAKIME